MRGRSRSTIAAKVLALLASLVLVAHAFGFAGRHECVGSCPIHQAAKSCCAHEGVAHADAPTPECQCVVVPAKETPTKVASLALPTPTEWVLDLPSAPEAGFFVTERAPFLLISRPEWPPGESPHPAYWLRGPPSL